MVDLFPVIYTLQHGYFSFGYVKCSPLHPHQLSCFAYRNILLLTTFERQAQFTFAIRTQESSQHAEEHFVFKSVNAQKQQNPLTAQLNYFFHTPHKTFLSGFKTGWL